MDIASGTESLLFTHLLLEGSLFYITVTIVTLAITLAFRVIFLFRKHHSWITYGIRLFGGVVPFVVSIYFIVTFTNNLTFSSIPVLSVIGTILSTGFGLAIGGVLSYVAGRRIEPWLISVLEKHTHQTNPPDTLTDIRDMQRNIGDEADIDISMEFSRAIANDEMFLGVGVDGEAITIDRTTWKSSHVQIMGPPGTGKGIQAGVTLTQSLKYGDAVYVFDPKNDEWAPSVFSAACQRAGVPFQYIDLNEPVAQINPLLNSTSEDVAEMLYAGLELSRTGSESDFYRLDDRKAARLAADFVKTDPVTLLEIANLAKSSSEGGLMTGAKAFFAAMDEIGELPCVQTHEGVDLAGPLNTGGCIYIVGSMRNDPIVILQKMLFVRIVQIVEGTRNRKRHCSIFLDEFKYLLSSTAVNALGSIRDKGCNILLAHQSLGDFANCGVNLGETTVRTTVLDTTPIKWLYRPADQASASWISDQTGRILAETQSVDTVRNLELSESHLDTRSVREVERNLYDINTVMSLPKGCAVCIGSGIAKLAKATAIKVDKIDVQPNPAPGVNSPGIDLLERLPIQVDADVGSDDSHGRLLEQDAELRLMQFLFEETWTHRDIVRDLLADVADSEFDGILAELSERKSINCHELAIGSTSAGEFWGITRKGIVEYQVISGISSDRPAFIKSMLNPKSILHRLDLQRLRLVAERAGWSQWQAQRPASLMEKDQIYPDATVRRPDSKRVAIEVERSVKTKGDYPKIMLGHLVARRTGHWDLVCYLSPDQATANRLRNIFSEIDELVYEGLKVAVTDEHRAVFQFYSYDEDWSESE